MYNVYFGLILGLVNSINTYLRLEIPLRESLALFHHTNSKWDLYLYIRKL